MGRKGVLTVPSQTAPVLYGDQQTGARGGTSELQGTNLSPHYAC